MITNKIILSGPVDYAMFNHLSLAMDAITDKLAPINIELCSEGGDGEIGMAIYAKIRSCPNLVYITAYGMVQSAAAVILLAGDYREAAVETWFMTHDSPELKKCKDKGRKEQLERQETQWAEVFAMHTGLPVREWRDMSRKTTYLNPAQMLQLGIIDAVKRNGKKHV